VLELRALFVLVPPVSRRTRRFFVLFGWNIEVFVLLNFIVIVNIFFTFPSGFGVRKTLPLYEVPNTIVSCFFGDNTFNLRFKL
jgi:hypothetical protein